MKKIGIHLLFITILQVIIMMLNIGNAIDSENLSVINVISTSVFVLALIGYSYYNGLNKRKDYLIFNIIYWSIIFASFIIVEFNPIPLLSALQILVIVPMYAISYTLIQFQMPLLIGLVVIEIMIIAIGYMVGSYINNRRNTA